MKKAVFPGSFDPLTLGHVAIIHRALPLFDELVIAIGTNETKKYRFSMEDRYFFLKETFEDIPNISIQHYEGLTVDFCKKINSKFILRGLRNSSDLEFEKAIAMTNNILSNIDTVFLIASIETSFISSTIVQDVLKHKGDISHFVPKSVLKKINLK